TRSPLSAPGAAPRRERRPGARSLEQVELDSFLHDAKLDGLRADAFDVHDDQIHATGEWEALTRGEIPRVVGCAANGFPDERSANRVHPDTRFIGKVREANHIIRDGDFVIRRSLVGVRDNSDRVEIGLKLLSDTTLGPKPIGVEREEVTRKVWLRGHEAHVHSRSRWHSMSAERYEEDAPEGVRIGKIVVELHELIFKIFLAVGHVRPVNALIRGRRIPER